MTPSDADYQRGEQNISEQVSSYRLFGGMAKWGSLVVGTLILMFTLWFCVGADFLGGLIPAAVLLAAGIFFLRSPPAQDH